MLCYVIQTNHEQVCVFSFYAYANNVPLPALARRTPRSTDISSVFSCMPTNFAAVTHGGTDRRTDSRQMHRPCSAYHASSASYTLNTNGKVKPSTAVLYRQAPL